MEYNEYLKEKKKLYECFLCFFEAESSNEENFSSLIKYINSHR